MRCGTGRRAASSGWTWGRLHTGRKVPGSGPSTGAEYKRKYGPREATVPFFWTSRFRALSSARTAASKAIKARQVARGRMTAVRSASRKS